VTGFADLIPQSQPAYYGSGHNTRATIGATWRWQFADVVDGAGDAIDLSAVTAVCEIVDNTGAVVAEPTVTGTALGALTIELDESVTATLDAGTYGWRLLIDGGADTWCVWNVGTASRPTSKFVIEAA
jgi:hypothetical protein